MRLRLLAPASAAVAAALALTLFAPSAPRADAAGDAFAIDPVHSFVLFRTDHMGVSAVYGRFNAMSGSVTWDAGNPAGSQVAMEVKTDSVDTGNADRDKHLRAPDFLDAAQFPTLSFKSTSVKANGNDLEVTGDLTLHGVTKPVTAKLSMRGPGKGFGNKTLIGFEGGFEIQRTDFGVGKPMGDNSVRVILAIEASK
jgi:polyisoprenoid-binding protein YceI